MMNRYAPSLAILAMAAITAPMVAQAQDPASAFKQIQRRSANGDNAGAIKLCDEMIKNLSSNKSRVAKQFSHMMPYFYWQKANTLSKMGKYEEAAAVFKSIGADERFRSPEMIRAARQNPGKALDYTPFFTAGQFQAAYNLFMLAAGTDKVEGKPEYAEKAVKELELYYKAVKAGKVSDMEKKQKLDSQVCFLLLQAALLQPTPDYDKASLYLAESKKSRSLLSEDMVMNALSTMSKVSKSDPKNIEWLGAAVKASPENYNRGILTMAKFAGKFLNYSIQAGEVVSTALKQGNVDLAVDAARTVMTLTPFISENDIVDIVFNEKLATIGESQLAKVPDKGWQLSYSPSQLKQIQKFYAKMAKDNMPLDGLSLLSSTSVVANLGSQRLSKAGYQLLRDCYPNLSSRDKEGKITSMSGKNLFQLSQLCRATGDNATAEKLEKKLETMGVGGSSKDTLIVNKMARLVGEQNWEQVIPAADEVMAAFAGKTGDSSYITAEFCKIAAYYKLNRFEDLVKAADGLLKSGKLKGDVAKKYEPQTIFFAADSYNKLGAADINNYDKAIEYAELYMQKYPSIDLKENKLAANLYYTAIDTLLKRRGKGDAAANAADMKQALGYCQAIATNWETHPLYPVSQLLAGSILIHGDDESRKSEAITLLENCYKSAVAQPKGKGKNTASNALFWLASYGPEIEMTGESEEKAAKRINGYYKAFWDDADQVGDAFCMQMGRLELKRSIEFGDKVAFKAAADHMFELVARESVQNVKSGVINPEIESAFGDAVEMYFDAMATLDTELSFAQKEDFFKNFKGIDPQDKSTQSIFLISRIDMESKHLASLSLDDPTRNEISNNISGAFRELTRNFAPVDLTSYGAVRVGNFLCQHVAALPESRQGEIKTAVAYYDRVLNDPSREMAADATLGKADILALSTSEPDIKQAGELYATIAAGSDRSLHAGALKGLTKLNMRAGQYAEAIKNSARFLKTRGNKIDRMIVMMLQGEAYAKSGDAKNALVAYMNIYGQNRGSIGYSSPACMAIMEIMWTRDTPASGDRLQGNFKPSDRWTAWKLGRDFVTQIVKSDIESKLTPADRDKFVAVRSAVDKYGRDAVVQKEEKSAGDFTQNVKSSN